MPETAIKLSPMVLIFSRECLSQSSSNFLKIIFSIVTAFAGDTLAESSVKSTISMNITETDLCKSAIVSSPYFNLSAIELGRIFKSKCSDFARSSSIIIFFCSSSELSSASILFILILFLIKKTNTSKNTNTTDKIINTKFFCCSSFSNFIPAKSISICFSATSRWYSIFANILRSSKFNIFSAISLPSIKYL